MRAKSTLQLRHQLTCNGITIQGAAYDTRRHHVLTADAPAKGLPTPPMLRLFSLRRELKCVPLLSDAFPPVKQPSSLPQVTVLMLEYAPRLDIFLCVYVVQDVYTIVFLETVSLRQLVSYPGPKAHMLRCVHYDDSSCRILLAVRIRRLQTDGSLEKVTHTLVRTASSGRLLTDQLEFLQLSKRSFQAASHDLEEPKQRIMLCVEKHRSPVLHPDSLTHVIGSANLHRVYGAGATSGVPSAYDSNKAVSEVFVMEWEDSNGQLVLIRRAVLAGNPIITSLALSTTGDWLFTGHANGQLKVWQVQSEGVGVAVGTSPYALGSTPIETPVELESENAIQKIVLQQASSLDALMTETMLFTVNQAHGSVKHWRFELLASTGHGKSYFTTDLCPHLECMGSYDVPLSTEPKPRKERAIPIPTSILSVKVEMDSFVENLVLLLRADVLNVLKVQCVLDILLSLPSSEDCFAIRRIDLDQGRTQRVLCLSGTQVTGVRLLSQTPSDDGTYYELVPPRLSSVFHSSPRVSAMDCINWNASDNALAVYGWTNGAVEVYSIPRNNRLALLRNPGISESISAVYMTLNSSIGSPRHKQKCVQNHGRIDDLRVLVCAATAAGQILCWEILLNMETPILIVEHAKTCVNHAHASSVLQLTTLEVGLTATIPTKAKRMLSLGSDGVVKLWAVPAMTMLTFVAATEDTSGPVSCMESVLAVDTSTYLAVGFEDGKLAVWCMQPRRLEFDSIPVTARHERRISSICNVPTQHSTEFTQFVTCSLDMTVILWKISADGVHEHRYFEIGAPVVSVCIIGNRAVAALAHEVCSFRMFNEPKQTLENDGLVLDQGLAEAVDNSESLLALQDDAPVVVADVAESEPTTEGRQSEQRHSPLPMQSARSFISIPSIQPQADQTADADIAQQNARFQPASNDSSTQFVSARSQLRAYLGNYIDQLGENGMISIDKLIQFTKAYQVPIGEHPRTIIRKHLKRMDADIHALSVDTCVEICQAIYHSGSKAARLFARNQQNQKRRNARKQHEYEIANKQPIVSYNCLGEKTISWENTNSYQSSKTSNQNEAQHALSPDIPAAKRYILDAGVSFDDLDGSEELVFRRANRKKSVADCIGQRLRAEYPDIDLLQRLSLSVVFQAMWSKGACWCDGNPPINVIWNQEDDQASSNDSVCSSCRKKRHFVQLHRATYRPHFSLRMVLGVIAEVYDQLAAPSHILLFARMEPDTEACLSIHEALVHVLRQQYGMQHVVELKLKLLYISMCHFVREIDAVAVFGELLGVFAPGRVDSIPREMVALCVSCYSWFYSREMVINGDAMIGRQKESNRLLSNIPVIEIENGKRTNWQFVKLQHASLCAQEILLYPLVSPGYLQNILLYMGEYSQSIPSFPIVANADDERAFQGHHPPKSATRWIEIHRFLRLLVGEWKEQSEEFYAVEQSLFVHPLISGSDPLRVQVIEKLRLLLNCFIVYDHERLGVIEVGDFDLLLRKLRYLWPNEQLTLEEAAQSTNQMSLTYENTILAAQQRFRDTEWDGRLCYLDFWAMLYIVGLKNNGLLKFREIPGFCRDYKLEITPELHDMLTSYMERSSSLLLPDGSHAGRHSLDQLASHQHRRRVGGLHDGVFVPTKTLRKSISLENMVSKSSDSSHSELYLEGAIPVMRQSASTSAMSRFQPVSHSADIINSDSNTPMDFSKGPVVVGIRPKGSKNKQTTLLRMASINGGLDSLVAAHQTDKTPTLAPVTAVSNPGSNESHLASSVYIQFPHIAPQYKRMPLIHRKNAESAVLAGHLSAIDTQLSLYADKILHEHVNDEAEMVKRRLSGTIKAYDTSEDMYRSKRKLLGHFTPHQSLKQIELEHKKPLPVPSAAHDQLASTHTDSKNKPKNNELVVVPTIEKSAVKSPSAVVTGSSKRALTTETVHINSPPAELVREESFKLEKWQSEDVDDASRGQDMVVPMPSNMDVESADKLIRLATATTFVEPRVSTTKFTQELASPVATEAMNHDIQTGKPEPASAIEIPRQKSIEVKVALNLPMIVEMPVANPEATNLPANGLTTLATAPPAALLIEELKPVKAVEILNVKELVTSIPDMELGESQNVILKDEKNHTVYASVRQTDTSADELNKEDLHSTPESVTDEVSTTAIALNESSSPVQPLPVIPAPEVQLIDLIIPAETKTVISAPTKLTPERPREHPIESFTTVSEPTVQTPDKLQPEVVSTNVKVAAQRHTFRFSQQPGFLFAVSSAKNRGNAAGINYDDYDSDSDDETSSEAMVNSSDKPHFHFHGDDVEEEDDGIPVEDMELLLSQTDRISSKEFAARAKMRSLSGSRTPSGKHGRTSRAMSRELESVDERTENVGIDLNPATASSVNRRSRQVERALYGEREENVFGEGIAFSTDAEQEMAHKWEQFFASAEVTMFSPLIKEMEEYQKGQRIAEEEQTKLMKKRLDEQAQDNLRLQQSRRSSSAFLESTDKKRRSDNGAAFRLHRMARESCQQTQTELQYGMSVTGQCKQADGVEYFHFCYRPETDGSILTVKLHIKHGDAHVFLSTQTTVPCSTDFMWRSLENVNEAQEGRKIILYPRELVKALTATNDPGSKQEASSMVIYLAVIALEPMTSFTLGVMTSGHRTEHSQAIRNVDSLIDRFSQLAKTFTGTHAIAHSESSFAHCTFADRGEADDSASFARRRETRKLNRIYSSPTNFDSDDENANDEDLELGPDDGLSSQLRQGSELSSFQHLLESIGDRHGGSERKTTSFLLAGPSREHYEFIHDEQLKLVETTQSLSPIGKRNGSQNPLGVRQVEREEEDSNVKAQVSLERRLARFRGSISSKTAKSIKKHRLSPLKAPMSMGALAAEATVNVQVAKFAPKPVAYSLSSLPRPSRISKQ